MNPPRYLAAYLGAGVVMAGLDSIWLITANQPIYRANLGPILTPGFRPAPAVLFYLIYLAGVVVLAVRPGAERNSLRSAASRGACLGFVAYATYDLTNQATLIVWSLKVTVPDLAWGTVLSAIAAMAGLASSRIVKDR